MTPANKYVACLYIGAFLMADIPVCCEVIGHSFNLARCCLVSGLVLKRLVLAEVGGAFGAVSAFMFQQVQSCFSNL